MKKETVVTFDGEDSFILPRNHSYNRRKGYAKFIGQDGTSQPEVTKKTESIQDAGTKANPAPPPPAVTAPPDNTSGKAPIIVDQPPVGSGDITKPIDADMPPGGGQTGSGNTGSYTNYSVGKFSMPDPTSPNFCENVNEFILTNGGGIATPPEITAARAAIAKYCGDKPPASQDPGTGSPRTGGNPPGGDPPPADTPPADTPKGDEPVNDLPKTPSGKTILPKPELPKVTKPKIVVDVPVIENLGLPIGTIPVVPVVTTDSVIKGGAMGGGIGGGGGGGEEQPPIVEEKKSYWWILVVAAVVGGFYYYRSRKK